MKDMIPKMLDCLKHHPGEKLAANEIRDWIFANYKEDCDTKLQTTSVKNTDELKRQITNEIRAQNKDSLKGYDIIVTEDSPKKYYYEECKDEKITTPNFENPYNKIWFGAPGTGKSYKLNEETKDFLGKKFEANHERVTFHPDYSYANFVGTYKPIMTKVEGKDNISYKYVPGPFMRVLVKALNNLEQNFVLVIEEINRANTAAVFGDVFQLLDRNSDGDSEYPIAVSEDMKSYLKQKLSKDIETIKIPRNMYIWATMNSADQGVFPMDTAFKRRWDFEYMDINAGEKEIAKNEFKVKENTITINWNNIRKAINDVLAEQKINEDKLMGAYFLSKSLLDSKDNERILSAFKSKVLMYLYEDAAKMKREQIFFEAGKRYSEICKKFDTNGIEVFNNVIQEKYYKKYNKPKSQSDEQNKE